MDRALTMCGMTPFVFVGIAIAIFSLGWSFGVAVCMLMNARK